MSEAVRALTLEFLRWISSRPRTYAETMQVWRTTCPRHSIWEDALADGLIELESTSDAARVTLTPRGETMLGQGPGERAAP